MTKSCHAAAMLARPAGRPRLTPLAWLVVACLMVLPRLALATPWMFDQDGDGLDDRLEAVALQGISAAYEGGDPQGKLRFEVQLVNNALTYGGYVLLNHPPTPADSVALTFLGAQVVSRLSAAPYLRIRAIFPALILIGQRPDVIRIEAVTLMYSLNWRTAQSVGIRPGTGAAYPPLEARTGLTGAGVVVALLDTGINDQPQGTYPGHDAVRGRVVGGAWFGGSGPVGYTGWTQSVNPEQSSLGLTSYHATHLAGAIGGSNGRTFGGAAPDVRFVDVKVLGDDGTGSGLAEGLEWCWRNRQKNWGGGASGIQLVNLSLSGTDPSNGDDCVCALVNALAGAGVIVVSSAGNDGRCGRLSAPGAADGAITVGALALPGGPGDLTDALAPFSNEGPRTDDGDATHLDELKPDVTAPGVDIVSAWGSPLSSGHGYRAASGTSAAAAWVTGTLALLKQADASLTPAAAKDLLHRTARHRSVDPRPCSAGLDPYDIDARYHSGWGYGALDAIAAWEELTHPTQTQLIDLTARFDNGAVEVSWTTQRELGLTGFEVQRAPDVNDAPGAFTPLSGGPVPAVGFSGLGGGNRTTYGSTDVGPGGGCLWYRVVAVGGAIPVTSAPVEVTAEPTLGTALITVRHNRPETDLTLTLGAGLPNAPDYTRPLPLPFGAHVLSAQLDNGIDTDITYSLSVPLFAADGAAGLLPPTPAIPWWLAAAEAGDPARTARLDHFHIHHSQQNYVTDAPLPQPTVEGATNRIWIPQPPTTGVDPRPAEPVSALRVSPNPARGAVHFELSLPAPSTARLVVLDVSGRVVRDFGTREMPSGAQSMTWDGRDDSGHPLAAGRYYARLDSPASRVLQSLILLH